MASNSYEIKCPNCGESLTVCENTRPFPVHSSDVCFSCGFYYSVKSGFVSLDELNQRRAEENSERTLLGSDELKPLKELPEQNEDLIWN